MPDTVTPERVLTIRRGFLDAIIAGRKTVEFRATTGPQEPTLIALHMAKAGGGEHAGSILAVAVMQRCVVWRENIDVCERCDEARAAHERRGEDTGPWPHGWHVSELRRVKPVAWRGNVGLPRYTGEPLEVIE